MIECFLFSSTAVWIPDQPISPRHTAGLGNHPHPVRSDPPGVPCASLGLAGFHPSHSPIRRVPRIRAVPPSRDNPIRPVTGHGNRSFPVERSRYPCSNDPFGLNPFSPREAFRFTMIAVLSPVQRMGCARVFQIDANILKPMDVNSFGLLRASACVPLVLVTSRGICSH